MRVSGPVRFLVVGDPVAHSLSPVIHTAALAASGIDGSYEARQVDEAGLKEVMDELRRGSLDGVNVTMPHKKTVVGLVDRLSPDATRAGSVNTVVPTSGELVGHSTDVSGLRRIWHERHLPRDGPVLVLGAGGAAAAAAVAAEATVMYASARRGEMIQQLADRIGHQLVAVPWGTAVSEAVVVNATPLGMQGESLPGLVASLASAVVDLAYTTGSTPAVTETTARGIPTVDGIDVLVAQAVDSFWLWTGRRVATNVMEAAARNPSSLPSPAPNEQVHGESL